MADTREDHHHHHHHHRHEKRGKRRGSREDRGGNGGGEKRRNQEWKHTGGHGEGQGDPDIPQNLRDVGETIAELYKEILEEQERTGKKVEGMGMEREVTREEMERVCGMVGRRRLVRGGHIEGVEDREVIFGARTILNVREPIDTKRWEGEGVVYLHHAAGKAHEKYNITERAVRQWMRSCVETVAGLEREGGPLFIHCRFGKDRTGIIVALLLALLGVPHDIIALEFMQSKEGFLRRENIVKVLNEVPEDVQQARRKFKGNDWGKMELFFQAD